MDKPSYAAAMEEAATISDEPGKPGYLIGSDIQDLDEIHRHLADSLTQSKAGAMFDSVELNSH